MVILAIISLHLVITISQNNRAYVDLKKTIEKEIIELEDKIAGIQKRGPGTTTDKIKYEEPRIPASASIESERSLSSE